jgi:nucleoid DNA-binding protein
LYNDFNAQVDAADLTQAAKYIKIFNDLQSQLVSGETITLREVGSISAHKKNERIFMQLVQV